MMQKESQENNERKESCSSKGKKEEMKISIPEPADASDVITKSHSDEKLNTSIQQQRKRPRGNTLPSTFSTASPKSTASNRCMDQQKGLTIHQINRDRGYSETIGRRVRTLSVASCKETNIKDCRLRVLIVIPDVVEDISRILAPITIFSQRCNVSLVAKKTRTQLHRVGIKSHFTFENAPKSNVDVVIVIGKSKLIRKWINNWFQQDQLPMLLSIKPSKITLYISNDVLAQKKRLDSRSEVDASLDLIDLLYKVHKNNADCLENTQFTEDDEGGEDDSSGCCCPSDMIAEELGLYRRAYHDERLERFATASSTDEKKNSVVKWFKNQANLFQREKFVAVLISEGSCELGLAALLDCWGTLKRCNVIPLFYTSSSVNGGSSNNAKAKRNKSIKKLQEQHLQQQQQKKKQQEQQGADYSSLEIKSSSGITLTGRSLDHFLSLPVGVDSLDTVIISPGSIHPKLIQKQLKKVLPSKTVILDQSEVGRSTVYSHQLEEIERIFSFKVAANAYLNLKF